MNNEGFYREHHFNIDIAQKFGMQSAVILNHIDFWIATNKSNNKNFYDNRYWTYHSKKALAETFIYLTPNQIEYALKKLIDEGIIITGNYNKSPYDRTLWFSITEKGYSILEHREQIELPKQ